LAETTTICVGNLAFRATEAELRLLFASVGEIVSVRLRKDRRGRLKGVGLVTFRGDIPEAVVEGLRGTRLAGDPVDIWTAPSERRRGSGTPNSKRGRR